MINFAQELKETSRKQKKLLKEKAVTLEKETVNKVYEEIETACKEAANRGEGSVKINFKSVTKNLEYLKVVESIYKLFYEEGFFLHYEYMVLYITWDKEALFERQEVTIYI